MSSGPTQPADSAVQTQHPRQAGGLRGRSTSGSAGKPPRRERNDVVVKLLEPLRETMTKRIDVRIIELRGERRLDVREYVDADAFQGYTRKGVCLSAEEFDALLAQREAIQAELGQ